MAADDGAAAAAVVDQVVDGLLQHALLVPHDDLGGAQLEQPPETVVPVDDPPVEVVEVARGEASAVQLHHGPQVRRQDGKVGDDHPFRLVPAATQRLHDPDALDRLLAPLAGGRPHLHLELLRKLLEVEPAEDVQDRLGAHAGAEHVAEFVVELTVTSLGHQHHRADAFDVRNRLLQLLLGLFLGLFGVLSELRDLLLDRGPAFVVGCLVLGVEGFEGLVRLGCERLHLLGVLLLERFDGPGTHEWVHRAHDVLGEVEDTLQVAWREVQEQAEPARDAFGEPDVRHRCRERDVPHALPADLRAGHLDAAAVADDALVADLLVLTAVALPVLGRTEDALAEQAVLLGAECAVVDRLRLGHLAVGPLLDLLGRGQ